MVQKTNLFGFYGDCTYIFCCHLSFQGTTKCCCKSSLLQMQAQQMKTLQFTRQFRTSSRREIERTGARVNQEFSVKPNQETVLSVDKNNLAITEGMEFKCY